MLSKVEPLYNPTMNVIVRKAEIKDFDEILKLNRSLFEFEDQFDHKYNLEWPYEEAGRKYFKKRFENKNSLIFVGEDQSQVVGYILAFIDTFSYRRINPICEIENMFVMEEYREKGIGKILINLVKTEAKKRNVKLLRVGAIAQNEKAISFYCSQGFSEANLYLEKVL